MVRRNDEVQIIARRVTQLFKKHYRVKIAYLFGSYVYGTPRDDSDIDIAIFADGVKKEHIEVRMNFIAGVQKEINAEVEIHLFDSSLLKEMRPSNFVGFISSNGQKIAA